MHKKQRKPRHAANTDPSITVPVLVSHGFVCLMLVLALVFLFALSVLSIILTVFGGANTDSPVYATTRVIPVCIGIAIWIIICIVLRRLDRVPSVKTVSIVALVSGFALSALWVFISNSGPTYDSLALSCAAFQLPGNRVPSSLGEEWAQYARDVWGLTMGADLTQYSYMGRFPFQIPYILLLWLCELIAGDGFGILAQLINAVSVGFTMFFVCKLSYEYSKSEFATLLSFGICLAFIPLVLFATFIYGNLICLPWGLAAWLLCLRALRDGAKPRRRLVLLLIASALIAVSILAKSTMNILGCHRTSCTLIGAYGDHACSHRGSYGYETARITAEARMGGDGHRWRL